jgi:hypothetical protein
VNALVAAWHPEVAGEAHPRYSIHNGQTGEPGGVGAGNNAGNQGRK